MLIDERREGVLLEGEKEVGFLEGEWRENGNITSN